MSGVGLYIHIPYCASICPYCDFNAYVAPKAPWAELQAALLCELEMRAPLFAGPLDSIYFGGGTPSLAPPDLIAGIIAAAGRHLGIKTQAEITLEANPGGLTLAKLQSLREAGINRLSMGWQSTNDKMLRVLGRNHCAKDCAQSFVMARKAGFAAISLDLIFAVPGQTQAQLQKDLETIIALSPEHVSLYAMTFKKGTPFERRRQRGSLKPVGEAQEVAMTDQIERALKNAGFMHYEVSNYAKSGATAVHNTLYWQGGQYLGIGPGAHSFLRDGYAKGWRWETTKKPDAYIRAFQSANHLHVGLLQSYGVEFCEQLSPAQLLLERLFCGLRHTDGILLSDFTSQQQRYLTTGIAKATSLGWVEESDGFLKPTHLGMRHVDAIVQLFLY